MTILKGERLTHEVVCEAGRCFVWVTQRIKKIIALCLCCSLLLSPVCQVDAQLVGFSNLVLFDSGG